ncbi:helix-turn-helix domain-containing protein [Haloarculaceae archaeon H-GB2-1]|nr:helix-turn-helix domain-containing protein [Haloarculaceae archaeon H-GB2-1]
MADSETDKIEIWCAGDDWCPITTTATLIGKKWHPVIVHRLLQNGPLGFNALKEEVDGISSKVLSDSLSDLEEAQLVDREIVSEKPFRVEYSLTERGADLEAVVTAMAEWGANTSCRLGTSPPSHEAVHSWGRVERIEPFEGRP